MGVFTAQVNKTIISVFQRQLFPSNSQSAWQNQVRLSKINVFNLHLPKESWIPDIVNRISAELTGYLHFKPPNKGMV